MACINFSNPSPLQRTSEILQRQPRVLDSVQASAGDVPRQLPMSCTNESSESHLSDSREESEYVFVPLAGTDPIGNSPATFADHDTFTDHRINLLGVGLVPLRDLFNALSIQEARCSCDEGENSKKNEYGDHDLSQVGTVEDHNYYTDHGFPDIPCDSPEASKGSQHHPSSSNGSVSLTSTGPDNGDCDGFADQPEQQDNNDERKRKRPRQPDDPQSSEEVFTDRNCAQIPCFVDDCPGKDTSMAELIRQAGKHHALYMCTECNQLFEDESTWGEHSTNRYDCEPTCISSTCYPAASIETGIPPLNRRHRRRMSCPPKRTVSKTDRWQFLWGLKYPDRELKSPNIETGCSHPHGSGRPRGPRQNRSRASSTASIEQELARTRHELELSRSIQDQVAKERDERVARMEAIIAACVTHMTASAPIPTILLRWINLDAPGALQSIDQSPVNGPAVGQIETDIERIFQPSPFDAHFNLLPKVEQSTNETRPLFSTSDTFTSDQPDWNELFPDHFD